MNIRIITILLSILSINATFGSEGLSAWNLIKQATTFNSVNSVPRTATNALPSSKPTYKYDLSRFDLGTAVYTGLSVTPAISGVVGLLKYCGKLPHTALLRTTQSTLAGQNVTDYLKENTKGNFSFGEIYISETGDGPGVFGEKNLILPKSWADEIDAHNKFKQLNEAKEIYTQLPDNAAKKSYEVKIRNLENKICTPENIKLAAAEKENKALRFEVILPHEQEHVERKHQLKISAVAASTFIPLAALSFLAGYPDIVLDPATLSPTAEISKAMLGAFNIYGANVVTGKYIRHTEDQADQAIKNKPLAIDYFLKQAKKNDYDGGFHRKPSARAAYIYKSHKKELATAGKKQTILPIKNN